MNIIKGTTDTMVSEAENIVVSTGDVVIRIKRNINENEHIAETRIMVHRVVDGVEQQPNGYVLGSSYLGHFRQDFKSGSIEE